MATARNLISSVMIYALVKRLKNESLNLKIDCVMAEKPSVDEQPVAQ